MTVTGPDWETTRRLREALAGVREGETLKWGGGGVNGLEQLQRFRTAGLKCPEFTDSLEVAKEWSQRGVEVWGRKLHHTQGRDIQTLEKLITLRSGKVVTRGNPQWSQSEFWVQVVESQGEFRQHVWKGRGVRSGRKVPGGEVSRRYPSEAIRSRKNGWVLDYGPWERPPGLRELGKAAMACVGYVGGAVDILQGVDGGLYVLECNSAPSCRDNNTLNAYVSAICKWGV